MRLFILPALAVLLLSGCAPQDMSTYDAHQRFRNKVESRELVASFKLGPLTPSDHAVLRDLAREHGRRGAAPVAISGPVDKAAEIADILKNHGIAADRMAISPGGDGAVSVAVPVWIAVVPECGRWEESINPDGANQNTWNFGCSVTRNIGLMVSDPADLVRARDTSGRDGNRAVDVIGKYGQGKATSSAAETGATSTLSTVGK